MLELALEFVAHRHHRAECRNNDRLICDARNRYFKRLDNRLADIGLGGASTHIDERALEGLKQ